MPSEKSLYDAGGWLVFTFGPIYMVLFIFVWKSYVESGALLWHAWIAVPLGGLIAGVVLMLQNGPQRRVTDYA
jgi:hypothetical protein